MPSRAVVNDESVLLIGELADLMSGAQRRSRPVPMIGETGPGGEVFVPESGNAVTAGRLAYVEGDPASGLPIASADTLGYIRHARRAGAAADSVWACLQKGDGTFGWFMLAEAV